MTEKELFIKMIEKTISIYADDEEKGMEIEETFIGGYTNIFLYGANSQTITFTFDNENGKLLYFE